MRPTTSRLLIEVVCDLTSPGKDSRVPEMIRSQGNELVHLAIRHGLGPLLMQKVKELDLWAELDPRLQENLNSQYLQTLAKNHRILHELKQISSSASDQKIDLMVLKGVALLAMIYHDPGLRPMDDADLAVRPGQMDPLIERCKELGFNRQAFYEGPAAEKLSQEQEKGWITMTKGEVMLDLHSRINFGRDGKFIEADWLFHQSGDLSYQNLNLQFPGVDFILLHLIIHIDKHFRKGITRYSNLADILLLLKLKGDSIDWNALNNLASETGSKREYRNWITLLNREFQLQIPLEKVRSGDGDLSKDFKGLEERYRQWMQEGERWVRPVVPPWQREPFRASGSVWEKMRYSWNILFPGFTYMRLAYRIPNNFLVLLYYPYRLVTHTFRFLIALMRRS